MKYLILLFVFNAAQAQEFKFTYVLDRNKLEYKTNASTQEEAFERGANFCFDFFSKQGTMTEARQLDIIDTCANPK